MKSNSFNILLILVSFLSLLIFSIFGGNHTLFCSIQLIIYILLICNNYLQERRLTLFQFWIVGFIYMIWSDITITCYESPSIFYYISAISFLIIANNILLLGYFSYKKVNHFQITHFTTVRSKLLLSITVFLFVFYVLSSYATIVASLVGGRQMSDTMGTGSVFAYLSSAAGLISPTLAAYYFRYLSPKSKWWSLLFFIPVLLTQVILATRFKLIYVTLPYMIVLGIIDLQRQKQKYLVILFTCAILLTGVSAFLKENRNGSFFDKNSSSTTHVNNESSILSFAKDMSPEGIVYMTKLSEDWFSQHSHSYGKEIGFMFYFIVPRSIWKDKPTPVDHWLIRQYENVPDTYSTASGFSGELRADFGWLCLIVLFFWGRLIKYLDNYAYNVFSHDGPYFEKVLAALIFPCIFFCVRSPLTATQSLAFQLILYYLIRKNTSAKSIE